MKKDNILFPVCLATIYFLVYLVLLSLEPAFHIAWLMMLLSPFVMVWLVVSILRNGRESNYHFEDRWY